MTEPQDTAPANPLVDLFHKILALLPWHAEADVIEAHKVVDDELGKLLGRNTTPAGVVKPTEAVQATETTVSQDPFNTGA